MKMHEILFRAKRVDTGEWVEGYPVKYGFTGKEKWHIIPSYASDLYAFEVNPDTICQFTGLTDKNGKCVFEGDIVKHYNKISIGEPDKYIIAAIRWEECKARFIQDTEDGIYAVYDSSVFEVIGNIFDNPELLGSE